MSALALLMKKWNKTVTGSDREESEKVILLRQKGIKVETGVVTNIHDTDLVVYTDAIGLDNVELNKYREEGYPCMARGAFLEQVCQQFDKVIAVAGSHGKTTTSAMLAHIILSAYPSTLHLGGEDSTYGNFCSTGKEYFITEACEYKKNIEKITSDIAVVTSLDLDHTDCYKNLEDMKYSFEKFVNKAQKTIILWENVFLDIQNKHVELVRVGFGADCEVFCFGLKKTSNGYTFHVRNGRQYVGKFVLNVHGEYNVKNALCAIAVCLQYDIPFNIIYDGLKSFSGVKRRDEKIGEINGVSVIADYAHHPTEIVQSIRGIKERFNKVLCVFQPHTYSRTIGLMEEFSQCFSGVNNLIIYRTYPAREKEDVRGNETALFRKVKLKNKQLALNRKDLMILLEENIVNADVALILGAGDIYDIIKEYLHNKQ